MQRAPKCDEYCRAAEPLAVRKTQDRRWPIRIEAYTLPIPESDLQAIRLALRAHEVLVPGFDAPDREVYSSTAYLREAAAGRDARLLVDRNMFSRWMALTTAPSLTEHHRLAAGLLAFAQSSGILVEPNMALYEGAAASSSEGATRELRLFRRLDESDPQLLADVALGRRGGLDESDLAPAPTELPEVDFSQRLKAWRRHYVILLKIATLELDPTLDSLARVSEALNWMHRDFIFTAPATVFAFHYLSPRARRKGLLKGLRSPDRSRAIEGVRNAAWDLALMTEWDRHIRRHGGAVLIATRDQWVARLVRLMSRADGLESDEEVLRERLLEVWIQSEVESICDLYSALVTEGDAATRAVNRDPPDVDALISEGEERLYDWDAGAGSS